MHKGSVGSTRMDTERVFVAIFVGGGIMGGIFVVYTVADCIQHYGLGRTVE